MARKKGKKASCVTQKQKIEQIEMPEKPYSPCLVRNRERERRKMLRIAIDSKCEGNPHWTNGAKFRRKSPNAG
jgi:hypothetical protein